MEPVSGEVTYRLTVLVYGCKPMMPKIASPSPSGSLKRVTRQALDSLRTFREDSPTIQTSGRPGRPSLQARLLPVKAII
jgi:hypothetical protein